MAVAKCRGTALMQGVTEIILKARSYSDFCHALHDCNNALLQSQQSVVFPAVAGVFPVFVKHFLRFPREWE